MDLNVMMREQAKMSLERELETAVTNGDTEAAKQVTEKISALAVASVPPPPPYGQKEIKAELEKHDWFGVDPEKTTAAIELGKNLDLKKFSTAADFAKALVGAVDKRFKTATPAAGENTDEDDDGGEGGDDGDSTRKDPPPTKRKATDGPNDGDSTQRSSTRRTSGPWTKLTDAPAAIQAEVKRAADKMAPKTKEGREGFITRALEAHYNAEQRKKGSK